MPRHARDVSESNLYHVMLRGVNRQTIFEDDEDQDYFLEILKRFKQECGFSLHGYCLMGNHVHLLIKTCGTQLQVVMKKIETAYVYYFNKKYGRVGHLFQDRYRSEAVTDDAQFLATLRYIHRNPVKAGICTRCADYHYSSYGEYLTGQCGLTDGSLAFELTSKEDLLKYTEKENTDRCMEMQNSQAYAVTDQQAKRILEKITDGKTAAEVQNFDKPTRNLLLAQLHASGLSVSQICRLTGISRGTVARNIK